jgi:hypothetical protein
LLKRRFAFFPLVFLACWNKAKWQTKKANKANGCASLIKSILRIKLMDHIFEVGDANQNGN